MSTVKKIVCAKHYKFYQKQFIDSEKKVLLINVLTTDDVLRFNKLKPM
ncbi:MAG: hypothetical protein RLZZ312_262 [Bacteroidota bacterium]|jgi:hypothetical protein